MENKNAPRVFGLMVVFVVLPFYRDYAKLRKLQSGNYLILGNAIAVEKDSIVMIEKIEKLD